MKLILNQNDFSEIKTNSFRLGQAGAIFPIGAFIKRIRMNIKLIRIRKSSGMQRFQKIIQMIL